MGSGISSNLDIDGVKQLVGEEHCNEVFDRYKKENGTVPINKLIALSEIETDVFLSHDWGLNQSNHNRVAKFNEYLLSKGLKTWFDADKMRGDILKKMCNGIDKTKCVVVFVTDNYVKKVGGNNYNDNCQLEFKYSMRQKSGRLMVPVCMEPDMANATDWKGDVGMVLGGTIYVNATTEINFDQSCKDLFDAINNCIKDNYPSILHPGLIVKKNEAPSNDSSNEIQPFMVVTKFDSSTVFKNIRIALANYSKKNIPENADEVSKKALSDLLEALTEGPYRQNDFGAIGTCEILSKFLKTRVESLSPDCIIIILKCIANLCSCRESELEPFVCSSENIASFLSSGLFDTLSESMADFIDSDNTQLSIEFHRLYAIAALADDNDACIEFDNAGVARVIAEIIDLIDLNEDQLPLLKNLCCAIARLNAFDENRKIKENFNKINFMGFIVKALEEIGPLDDDFAVQAAKAIGSLLYQDKTWYETKDKYFKHLKSNMNRSYWDDEYKKEEEQSDDEVDCDGINTSLGPVLCIIDVIREVGINNSKAAEVATNALAKMLGVGGLQIDVCCRGCRFESIKFRVKFYIDEIIGSKIEVQLVKILKKFSDIGVIINSLRCLYGMLSSFEYYCRPIDQRFIIELEEDLNCADESSTDYFEKERIVRKFEMRPKEEFRERLEKMNLLPILFDIIQELGLKPMNYMKDEVTVLNILAFLRSYVPIKNTHISKLIDVLSIISTRFFDTSYKVFGEVLELLIKLVFGDSEDDALEKLGIIQKISEKGFIELVCNLYFKYRYQIYLSIIWFFSYFCESLIYNAKKDKYKEHERQQFLEAYEAIKSKFVDAGIIQMCLDCYNTRNYERLIALGYEEMEREEFCDCLVKCKLLEDYIIRVEDDGTVIYKNANRDDDHDDDRDDDCDDDLGEEY